MSEKNTSDGLPPKLDEKYVKRYFKGKGTVSKWWEPESPQSRWLEQLYVEQRKILKQVFNPSGKRILDVGTGKGRFAIDFALSGAKQVVALDISEEMLQTAKDRARNAEVTDKILFLEGDAENLSFSENTFDVTTCMSTIVHLPNPQRTMSELARVTKRLGMIIADINTRQRSMKSVILAPFYRFVLYPARKIPSHYVPSASPKKQSKIEKPVYTNMSKNEFSALFISSRLKIIKMIRQDPIFSALSYIIVGKKQ